MAYIVFTYLSEAIWDICQIRTDGLLFVTQISIAWIRPEAMRILSMTWSHIFYVNLLFAIFCETTSSWRWDTSMCHHVGGGGKKLSTVRFINHSSKSIIICLLEFLNFFLNIHRLLASSLTIPVMNNVWRVTNLIDACFKLAKYFCQLLSIFAYIPTTTTCN